MKNSNIYNKLICISNLCLILYSQSSLANVNIQNKIQQVKSNISVSEKNKRQYEQSYKTTLANLNTIQKSLENLEKVQGLALKDKKIIEANKQKYNQLMAEYKKFSSEEEAYLQQEEKLAESLKSQLKQVYLNIQKRKMNIKAYNKVVAEADQRSKSWQKKSRDIASVVNQAESSKKRLLNEGNDWTKKQKIYKSEMQKWDKQKKTSEVNLKLIQAL